MVSEHNLDTDNRYERLQKMLRNIPIVQWWNSRGEKVETSSSQFRTGIGNPIFFLLSRWRIVRKLPTFSNFTTTTSTGSREQLRMPPSISIQHFMIRGRKIHEMDGEMEMKRWKLIDFRAGNSVPKVRVLGMLNRTTMQVRKQLVSEWSTLIGRDCALIGRNLLCCHQGLCHNNT